MQVRHSEGVAIHADPESCAAFMHQDGGSFKRPALNVGSSPPHCNCLSARSGVSRIVGKGSWSCGAPGGNLAQLSEDANKSWCSPAGERPAPVRP